MHQTVTGKRPEQETDQSHLTKFLTSINNVEISREICRQGIPHGTTLQDLFLKVTEKEAGQQLAEGVVLAHSNPSHGNPRYGSTILVLQRIRSFTKRL